MASVLLFTEILACSCLACESASLGARIFSRSSVSELFSKQSPALQVTAGSHLLLKASQHLRNLHALQWNPKPFQVNAVHAGQAIKHAEHLGRSWQKEPLCQLTPLNSRNWACSIFQDSMREVT